jgi:putative redox protein
MSYLEDQEFEFKNNSNNSLTVDMHDDNLKKNHSPMELLLSALTSCAAVEIVSMIKKRRRDFKDLKAITTGIRAKNPPRFFKSINIEYQIYSSDLTKVEARRFISLSIEKYCSVGATIRTDTIVNHSFEIFRD